MLIVLLEDLMAAIELNGKGEELTLPCLQPVKAHHDEIIEMKWSKNNLVWATGAKDGRCCLWELRRGEQANYESGLRVLRINESAATLTEVAYFDVFPSDTSANFFGSWSNYPWLPNSTCDASDYDCVHDVAFKNAEHIIHDTYISVLYW